MTPKIKKIWPRRPRPAYAAAAAGGAGSDAVGGYIITAEGGGWTYERNSLNLKPV